MDAQSTITEVVEGVKSEGLFDQFRKECLEEFENMETYHQLKQRVQNHVTSFLSKHKYHDGLQKNTLRSNLRNYISKSDVLINSITQLVDEVLSLKGKSFCLRIDKQVDKHLSKNVPVPESPPCQGNNSKTTGESNSESSNNGIPMDSSAKVNSSSDNLNNVIVEGQKEIMANGTITEFSEMEIEEVEMEISENQEVDETYEGEADNKLLNNCVAVVSDECTETHNNVVLDTIAKIGDVNDFVEQVNTANHVVCETEIKIDPENTFQPIVVKTEDVGSDIVGKKELGAEANSGSESEEVAYDGSDGDRLGSLNLPPIITEPISDDSNSNDSTFADNIREQMKYRTSQDEEPVKKDDCRRKSSRVRTLPLKFRELDDVKKRDDVDSHSSNEIDYKDLEDGTYLTGKRGRSKKRPQSAGNPETAKSRKERPSSISRLSMENAGRKKHGSSISKQEEEAINFLTKPSVRKTMTREGHNSPIDDIERISQMTMDRSCESEESQDGNLTDKHVGYSHASDGCQNSELSEGKFDKKSEQDSDDRTGGKDDGRNKDYSTSSSGMARKEANRTLLSKKYIKSESGERSYSSIDDHDKNVRSIKDKKDLESREGTSAGNDGDRKSHTRKDHNTSGSGKDEDRRDRKSSGSGKDDDRKDQKQLLSGKDIDMRDHKSPVCGKDYDRKDRQSSGLGQDDSRRERKLSGSGKDVARKEHKLSGSRKDIDRKVCKSPSSRKDDERRDRKSPGSGKDDDRKDRKSCGLGKDDDRKDRRSPTSIKDEDRSSGRAKDVNRSEHVKREYLSDSGSTTSVKDDLDRKSRSERDVDITREDRDIHRTTHKKKRPHSPIASPEDSQSKRSRRSIKQRQRYSPP